MYQDKLSIFTIIIANDLCMQIPSSHTLEDQVKEGARQVKLPFI